MYVCDELCDAVMYRRHSGQWGVSAGSTSCRTRRSHIQRLPSSASAQKRQTSFQLMPQVSRQSISVKNYSF